MKDSNEFFTILIILVMFGLYELAGLGIGGRDDIQAYHIEQAYEVCANNDGLKKIEGESFTPHEFICNNGAVFVYEPEERTIK